MNQENKILELLSRIVDLLLLTQTSHTDKVFCTLKIQYFSQ